ncbi:hypothetical protein PM007_02875 [[Clostridium] symbiosum]|nr:hypothetical protein [[Clostridium] symbiosum]
MIGWIFAAAGVVGMCVNWHVCGAVGNLFAGCGKGLVLFHGL